MLPYILPTGRLFAATGSQLAPHVVFVMFAGGVRQQESFCSVTWPTVSSSLRRDIMVNMLNGAMPTLKRAFGTDPGVGPNGSVPIQQLLTTTLQSQGTLFPELRATTADTLVQYPAHRKYRNHTRLASKACVSNLFEYLVGMPALQPARFGLWATYRQQLTFAQLFRAPKLRCIVWCQLFGTQYHFRK